MAVVTDDSTGEQYRASSMYPEDYDENPSYFERVDISRAAQKALDERSNTMLWLVSSNTEELLLTDSEYRDRFWPETHD